MSVYIYEILFVVTCSFFYMSFLDGLWIKWKLCRKTEQNKYRINVHQKKIFNLNASFVCMLSWKLYLLSPKVFHGSIAACCRGYRANFPAQNAVRLARGTRNGTLSLEKGHVFPIALRHWQQISWLTQPRVERLTVPLGCLLTATVCKNYR